MKHNLVYKLFATYLVLALVAIITVYVHLGGHIKSHLGNKIEESLLTSARLIHATTSLSEMEQTALSIAAVSETRVTLLDKSGAVLADTEYSPLEMGNHFNRPEIQEARLKGAGKDTRTSATLGIETLYVALAIEEKSQTTGYIRLARPLTEIRDSMNALNMALLQSFLLISILSFLVAWIFSIRMVSPIQEMEQFTKKLQQGEFPGTLLISTADERGRLARNINFLVNELRDKIRLAEEEKGKLEAAFSSMNDGVLILDRDGTIEKTNASFDSMFSCDPEDIVGTTPLYAFRNVDLEEILEQFGRTGETLSREITLGKGDSRTMDVTLCPIQATSGKDAKTMIVFHDVTRLKQLEQTRADFVANVTHEIKTPLSAILGAIETLMEGALEDRTTALSFLETVRRQAERLNRLVDDLLILSDIELGELPLAMEAIPLEAAISGLWPLVEAQASKKDVRLFRDIPGELPPLRADRDRLAQILINVLDNAVKYTEPGGTVTLLAERDDTGHCIIRVIDSGIGIPANDLSRLGERFYRVDRARSRQSGGTGLGLSIVKHLVAAHGGVMKISSEPGKGTEVRLTFPLAK